MLGDELKPYSLKRRFEKPKTSWDLEIYAALFRYLVQFQRKRRMVLTKSSVVWGNTIYRQKDTWVMGYCGQFIEAFSEFC